MIQPQSLQGHRLGAAWEAAACFSVWHSPGPQACNPPQIRLFLCGECLSAQEPRPVAKAGQPHHLRRQFLFSGASTGPADSWGFRESPVN